MSQIDITQRRVYAGTLGSPAPIIYVIDSPEHPFDTEPLQRHAATIVTLPVTDWNAALTPWPAPGIYRGEPDANFVMSTSLRRNCKEKSRLLEAHVLRNFTKYAILEEPTIGGSVWQQMMLGQRCG